ncbi:MAG: ABC transporter substrate-binding protein [Fimbriimonadales bacterium]
MSKRHNDQWSRRDFLTTAALAGTGAILGMRSESLAAEPPPETTKIRLIPIRGTICYAPLYMAQELLRQEEGFTDVEYVMTGGAIEAEKLLAAGKGDLHVAFTGRALIRVDAGDPIAILSGLHPGCFELFGTNQIRALRDLKGKSVAVTDLGSGRHVFLSSMLAYVGLDPRKDVNFVTHPAAEAMRLLAEGKIDAFMAFPPDPQELRAKKIGHVVVNMMMDRPWSQYFCCVVTGNRDFVRKNPVATKRALRAILKANKICGIEPERVARFLVDKGYTPRYDYAVQTLKEIPYAKWIEYDPEDTVRFYSLRLNEVGMIKSSPQKIISQGTDWRFIRELKKELKA